MYICMQYDNLQKPRLESLFFLKITTKEMSISIFQCTFNYLRHRHGQYELEPIMEAERQRFRWVTPDDASTMSHCVVQLDEEKYGSAL